MAKVKTNIRHNISRRLVAKQIEKAVAEHESRRAQEKEWAAHNREVYATQPSLFRHPPRSDEEIDAMFDGWIKQEREHYAKVRVIRLANTPKPSYVLVYGDVVDAEVTTGTGPFDKLSKARSWFLKSGR